MSPKSNPTVFAPSAFRGVLRRTDLQALCRASEPQALAPLLAQARCDAPTTQKIQALALRLAGALRERSGGSGRAGLVQSLLQEFSLSSQEGVALMCLAEALLRIPDKATRDALIRDKIGNGQWESHLGKSPSLFVNAATWGLLLTGKLVATHSEQTLSSLLVRLTAKGGEPLIRKSVDMAMRMMGEQFVTGETIADALSNAREREAAGFRFSYDMLGEAALTQHDAQRYLDAYKAAIHAIGKASNGRGIYEGPGISIKLSALHPRYQRAQSQRVHDELYPTLLSLAVLSRQYGIGLNIDAEETERLELSLELLERLCSEPTLAGWNGLGFVIQAYQKRCPAVIDEVIAMARRTSRRLMVRLVKGAYWDSEIKRAQTEGQSDFPVYTRKAHTDVSYIACARKLLAAPEAVYPQFATHNAHTLATIHELADPASYHPGQYEFQCLHGMGEPLYEQVVRPVAQGGLGRPCRVYAPVGTHETLLAYLVRRLLENGANTSFVNRIADESISLEELVRDPVEAVDASTATEGSAALPHARIAHPAELYGAARANSAGLDLASETVLSQINQALQESTQQTWSAAPMLAADAVAGTPIAVCNPADPGDTVGQVQNASLPDVERALAWAQTDGLAWTDTPATTRANVLLRAADLMQAQMPSLMALLMREAGKTASNAIAEVREAIDFLRYYAQETRDQPTPDAARSALGNVVCISPWNFPLAIFIGQVSAALAAGNRVLAKPAEQTPLIAAQAVQLLWQAGVPRAAVQLLPGPGEIIGAALVADARTMGVVFTGSTQVARLIQKSVCARLDSQGQPVTLIAETGGQNAMIVDSSALAEQAVNDIVASAFDSAGQRCSALRVLCIQEDAAPHLLPMLRGAMKELQLGNPVQLATDVGPVIDAEARAGILDHIEAMRLRGCAVFQTQAAPTEGTFVAPTLIEIDRMDQLKREVFGPVLHVLRYAREDLPRLLDDINATGYGLTLGLHTRIDETIAQVLAQAHAGNTYVNRNMVGAVVGVQPFGGEGLSGTGPKAGGPLYLRRLCHNPGGFIDAVLPPPAALIALQDWARSTQRDALAAACATFATQSPTGPSHTLAGPTGERNVYSILPRTTIGCLASDQDDLLIQLAAILAIGGTALWEDNGARTLFAQLPETVQKAIEFSTTGLLQAPSLGVVVQHGSTEQLLATSQALADRPGAIVTLLGLAPGTTHFAFDRLVLERSLSVNTAAAGGNASLMTIG